MVIDPKIPNYKIEALPLEYSIILKILNYKKISNEKVIKFYKKDLQKILYDKNFLNFLNDYEKQWCEDTILNISDDEFIFDSSKSRIVVKKTFDIFLSKITKEQNDFFNIQKKTLGINAICLGYPKCATTWFYNVIKQINLFDFGKQKEIEYFDSLSFINSFEWYENHFNFDISNIKIDISVGYMNNNLRGVDRILNYQSLNQKNIDFLLFVRKPSDRFISYVKYRMLTGRGFYNLEKYCNSYHAYNNFIRTSDYQNDIEKLMLKGIKTENIFVVFQEDIKTNSLKVFSQICKYLLKKDLTQNDLKSIDFNKKYNKGKAVRFFKLYKMINDLDAYTFIIFRKFKFLLYLHNVLFRKLRNLFITDKIDNDKIKIFASSIESLNELDKKYKKLKTFLDENKINYSRINS